MCSTRLTPREEKVLRLRFGLEDGRPARWRRWARSSTSPASASARSRPRPCASCAIPSRSNHLPDPRHRPQDRRGDPGAVRRGPRIVATLEKDTCKTYEEALLEIYRKLRPGEPPTVDSPRPCSTACSLIPAATTCPGWAAISSTRSSPWPAASPAIRPPVANPATGEVLAEAGPP